ncbi:competence protein ComJ [Consotaella aegiceratis]|uniref:competence protein ComJ n=1 Tax=Consotaella aegiceratis TaxID=3097961 RepID=UPI002F3E6D68
MQDHNYDGTMNMLASLDVMISYGQLVIYLPSIQHPGHLWSDDELDQGFAWSPGIVSLGVPEHAFICLVNIDVANDFKLASNAISCLRVPFDIFETPVYVGSIYHYEAVKIKNGRYQLFYEVLPGQGTWEIYSNGKKDQGKYSYILNIVLVPGENDYFEILKVGGSIHTDKFLSRLSNLG